MEQQTWLAGEVVALADRGVFIPCQIVRDEGWAYRVVFAAGNHGYFGANNFRKAEDWQIVEFYRMANRCPFGGR